MSHEFPARDSIVGSSCDFSAESCRLLVRFVRYQVEGGVDEQFVGALRLAEDGKDHVPLVPPAGGPGEWLGQAVERRRMWTAVRPDPPRNLHAVDRQLLVFPPR